MRTMTRRNALKLAAAACGTSLTLRANADESCESNDADAAMWAEQRAKVLAAGFTPDEAECWELVARASGKFFELPVLHELDAHEVSEAIHVIQNKLLSRPTYRIYRDARP